MVNDTEYFDLTYTVIRIGNDRDGTQTVTWTLSGANVEGFDAATVDTFNQHYGWQNGDVVGSVSGDRATSGTLVFENNTDNTKTITIRVHKDHYQENPEAFKITLSNPTEGLSVSATTGVAEGRITDDDIALVLSATSAQRSVIKPEGQPDDGADTYTDYTWVIQRKGVAEAVDLSWSVQGHSVYLGSWVDASGIYQSGWTPSATADSSDFDPSTLTGTLRFTANETSKTLTIRVLGDETVESTEAFKVVFTKPANVGDISGLGFWNAGDPTTSFLEGVILRDEGQFAIVSQALDIDSTAAFDPDDYSTLDASTAKAEGDTGYVSHFFKIYRDFTTSGDASVEWRVENGHVGVVTDASPFLSHAISTAATVVDFVDGQNTLEQTNGLPSGRVTIPDGEAYVLIEVKTQGDLTAEDADSFQIRLSNPSPGSTVSPYSQTAMGYIANDDHPLFSIGKIIPDGTNGLESANYGSKVVTEGDTVTYTVYRSGSTAHEAKVNWTVIFPDPVSGASMTDTNSANNYTASALDFVDNPVLNGTLTFAPGEASRTITLRVKVDGSAESWAEAFSIALSHARWGDEVPNEVKTSQTPAISAVAGTMESIIVDADAPTATVAVTAVQSKGGGYEGTNEVSTIVYTLTKTGTGAGQIAWKLQLPNAGDIASITGATNAVITQNTHEGRFFASGLVAFGAQETVKTITVTLNADTVIESNENFVFTLIDGKTVLKQGFAFGNEAEGLGTPWGLVGSDGTVNANSAGIQLLDAYGNIPDSAGMHRDATNYTVTSLVKNDDGKIVVNNVINHYWNVGANVLEGDSGPTVFTASITRHGRIDHLVTVDYEVLNPASEVVGSGTWTLDGDANNTNGSGAKTYTMNFVLGDGGNKVVELNETYTIRLKNISDPNILFNQAEWASDGAITRDIPVTIVNDDTVWSMSATTTSQSESHDFQPYTFTISRPNDAAYYRGAATVTYRIVGDDGAYTIDGEDIVGGLGERTVNFANGETSKVVEFRVKGDKVAERDETFKVELVSASQGVVHETDKVATFTILNDDTTIEIANAVSVREGDVDGAYLEFDVIRKGQIDKTSSSVTWTVQDGTATVTDDLVSGFNKTGSMAFDAAQNAVTTVVDAGYGEQTQKVRVNIKGDTTPEADQSLSVSLSNVIGTDVVLAGKGIATGTLLNDDSTFSVSVGEAVFEANAQGQIFTITRTHATAQDQTINWSIAGSGLRPAQDADFAGPLSGSVTFTGSELSKSVTVPFINDAVAEYDETYTLTIALGAETDGDTVTTSAVTGTIKNDDATLTVSFAEGKNSIREGSGSDTHNVEFVVHRNFNLTGTASATWTLSGHAVTAGRFETTSDTVTFADGETSKTVSVAVVPNATDGLDQTFAVTLSNPTGAQVLTGAGDSATATIVDDDSTIAIRGDASVLELNSGSNTIVFTLDRTGGTEFASVVGWRVVKTGNLANNAVEADFLGGVLPFGTLSLAAGQSVIELSVPGILGDLAFEGDETFQLELIAPSAPDAGLTIDLVKGSATGTILNNEARVDIRDALAYANAAASSEGSDVTFTVVRTGYLGMSSTVTWDIAYRDIDPNGSGDFVGGLLPSGSVTFAPGEAARDITVRINPDNVSELDEVFRLKLLTASEGTSIGTQNSFFKVVNDDADRITLSAGTPTQAEGDGTEYTTYTFTLTRENPWIATSVDWAAQGSGEYALANDRFESMDGTASFVRGELTTTFDVRVRRDDIGDFDRTFEVTVSNPVTGDVQGATLVNTSVTGVVQNDDPAYAVALSSNRFVEGSGTANKLVSFTITRSGDVSGTAEIRWTIAADENSSSPANLSDFGGYWPTGVTAFAEGEIVKTIQVAIAPDSRFEADEGFTVKLSDLKTTDLGARIIVPEVRAMIANDDIGVTVEKSVDTVLEGNDGQETPVTFTIRAEGVPNKTVTVNFVLEGSGNSPADADDFFFDYLDGNYEDYEFDADTNSGQVVLRTDSEGQTYAEVLVQVVGDDIAGSDETFRLRITDVQGGTIAQGMAEVIIENDDVVIASIVNTTGDAKEGNADEKIFTFVLTRMGDVSDEASISYFVEGFGDNPADQADFDGSLPEGLATFAAGSSTATIEVRVSGDVNFESDEGFIVIVGKNTANEVRLATEIRNDELAGLEFNGLVTTVFEGNGGSSVNALSYEIVRSGDNSTPLTVGYVIEGGSLADFAQSLGLTLNDDKLVGSIVIPAGESRVVLNLPVAGDTVSGKDREFTVSIDAPGFAPPAPVSGNVVDDDSGVSLELVGSDTQAESDSTIFTFRVNRVGNDLAATTLAWAIAGIGLNPASANDFSAATGMIAFTGVDATASSKVFTVTVRNDAVVENTEAFRVTLTYPQLETNQSSPIRVATADAHISDDNVVTTGADLIYGGAGADVIDALAGHDVIRAGAGADVIHGGDGNDTIYGEGGADAIYGGAGNDRIVLNADNISHFNAATGQASTYIDGGLGDDTLVIDGADIVFDFSAAAVSGAIRGVELIDITGSGDNTLRLSWADFYHVFEDDSSEFLQLTIDGNAGDAVVLLDSSEWVRDETDNLGYIVWNHQSMHAQLWIHSEVTTSIFGII